MIPRRGASVPGTSPPTGETWRQGCDSTGRWPPIDFTPPWVEEGGSRRAAAFVRNLNRKRPSEGADEQPAPAVLKFGPIFVGPQNLDRDVASEAPHVRHQQFPGNISSNKV